MKKTNTLPALVGLNFIGMFFWTSLTINDIVTPWLGIPMTFLCALGLLASFHSILKGNMSMDGPAPAPKRLRQQAQDFFQANVHDVSDAQFLRDQLDVVPMNSTTYNRIQRIILRLEQAEDVHDTLLETVESTSHQLTEARDLLGVESRNLVDGEFLAALKKRLGAPPAISKEIACGFFAAVDHQVSKQNEEKSGPKSL